MKTINKKSVIIFIVIGLIVTLVFALSINATKIKSIFSDHIISNIAYDVNPSYGYTVYIKENNIYVPYLVLTNHYGNRNATLLLRKNLMGSGDIDTTRKNCWEADSYIGAKPFSEYDRYDKTKMDYYLNNDIIKLFATEMASIIHNTDIKIDNTDPENYGSMYIKRKIFLLSAAEVGCSYGPDEGKPLKYFKDPNNRKATLENEKSIIPWWTRTNGWTYYCAFGFNGGLITESSTDEYYGVRPAFCIPSNTVIEKKDSILSGQAVYVIKNDL